MKTIITMPKIGWTMEEGKIVRWLKGEGENVEKGDPLFMVETEKVTNEIESTGTGVLRKILIPEGHTVPVTEALAILAEPDEEIPDLEKMIERAKEVMEASREPVAVVKKPAAKKVESPMIEKPMAKVKISPAARKLAQIHSIDVSRLVGTGPSGRITRTDVMSAVETKAPPIEQEVFPLTGARKVMSERLYHSARTYAPVMMSFEVDMTNLMELRRKLRPQWEKKGLRISVTAFIVKATIETLKENPIFNSSLQNGDIIIKKNINIGVATAVTGESFWGDNLLVSVIPKAEKKSLAEIASRVTEVRERADQKTLTMDDVSGSTFTISNFGALGVKTGISTSLINPPESAILGVGNIAEKPVVREGKIVIRSIMDLMLTMDHRIIYPTDGMRFVRKITELLENPATLLDESVNNSKM